MSQQAVSTRFPATFIALVFAVIVSFGALMGDINVIDTPFEFVARIEQNETLEILTSWFIVIVAFAFDQIVMTRRMKQVGRLDNERLRVVQVTMRTVQDIVNNCLNQLQLLRLDAEDHGVSRESVEFFDDAIHETSAKLKALGDLKAFAEKEMEIGAGLDVGGG